MTNTQGRQTTSNTKTIPSSWNSSQKEQKSWIAQIVEGKWHIIKSKLAGLSHRVSSESVLTFLPVDSIGFALVVQVGAFRWISQQSENPPESIDGQTGLRYLCDPFFCLSLGLFIRAWLGPGWRVGILLSKYLFALNVWALLMMLPFFNLHAVVVWLPFVIQEQKILKPHVDNFFCAAHYEPEIKILRLALS